jgi:hypothetical protein
MTMLGPKHTAEAVTRELIEGLEDGSVVLHGEEPETAGAWYLPDHHLIPVPGWVPAKGQPQGSLVLVILATALGLLGLLAAWRLFF